MRKAATAAFATAVFVVSVAAAPLASADPVQDALPVECATLAVLVDPTCLLVEQVDGVLAPVADAPGEAPTPATSGGSDAPEPAPAPSSTTRATSAAAPTAADLGSAPTQPAGAASSPSVPNLPAGSTLELGSLGLPSLGLAGMPAITGTRLAAGAENLALPAARAAASVPDASKTTAVAMAFAMLLLAGGLLIDQVRKARIPIQL